LKEHLKCELGFQLEGIEDHIQKRRLKESQFDSEKGLEAAKKRWQKGEKEPMRLSSAEESRMWSSHAIAKRVGISHASYEKSQEENQEGV
jgi:hypothetical protein